MVTEVGFPKRGLKGQLLDTSMTWFPTTHPAIRTHRLEALELDTTERNWTLVAVTLATAAAYWLNAASFLLVADISGNLGASMEEGVWLITAYITAYAVGIALSHRLANFLGNKRLLYYSCLIFAAAALGQSLSSNLSEFLVFRVIAGLAGGSFLARSLVFFTHRYARPDRAIPMRNFGSAFALIGMVIAPIASGWMNDVISWRMAYAAAIPISLVAAYILRTYTADHWIADIEDHKPDILGILLLVAGVSTLQALLDRGELHGWFDSTGIRWLTLAMLIANGAFLLWQFVPQNKHPLVNAYHIFDRGMFAGAVLAVFLGFALSGDTYVLYSYLREVETHSALQTGLLMSINGAAVVFIMWNIPLVVRMLIRFGGRKVIFVSLVLQMLSMLLLVQSVTSDTPDRYLWIPLLLSGAAMGIMIPCLSLTAFAKMDVQVMSNARTLYYGIREIGVSFGVTLTDVLVDRRTALHSERLFGEVFSRGNISHAVYPGVAGTVMEQALVLSYQDVFVAVGAVALLTCFLLPLLPAPPKRAAVPNPNPSLLSPKEAK